MNAVCQCGDNCGRASTLVTGGMELRLSARFTRRRRVIATVIVSAIVQHNSKSGEEVGVVSHSDLLLL